MNEPKAYGFRLSRRLIEPDAQHDRRHSHANWPPIPQRSLRSLALADGSKSKVRNIFSAIFNHGIRHKLASTNPIVGPVGGLCDAERQAS